MGPFFQNFQNIWIWRTPENSLKNGPVFHENAIKMGTFSAKATLKKMGRGFEA